MSAPPPSSREIGVPQLSTVALSNAADALVFEFHRQRNANACRACCVTIIKLIDNVLRHNDSNRDGDMYSKVRSINLSNKVIQQSIVSYTGGLKFLLALGFTRMMQTTIGDPNVLTLLPENEDVPHFIKGRQLLQSICIYELHCQINEVPQPPPVVANSSDPALSSARNASTPSNRSQEFPGGFNPYQGQRVDIGVPQGQNRYPSDYKSPTEMELQRLAAAQAKLEQQVQVSLTAHREWTLGTGTAASPAAATVSSDPPRMGDGALLAARAQTLQAERQARETAGFTTKAMREVEQMKRARVYSHVQLCIHVPVVVPENGNTTTLLQFSGKFLPRETIGHVMDALIQDCFLSSITRKDFELYITPPKRILSNFDQTLHQEGLVPAAKVFCRWTTFKTIPLTSESLQSQWINEWNSSASVNSNPNLAFPTSVPVITAASTVRATEATNDATDDSKKKKAPMSKEEELLQRMMGRTSRNLPKKKNDADGPPSKNEKSGTNKHKWFHS
jgi:PUB domain